MTTRGLAAGALTVALGVLLAGCMLLPGRFASELALRRDGTFSFHYKGEIILTPLAQPSGSSTSASKDDEQVNAFEQQSCSDESTGEDRPCTAVEIAAQRKDWEAARAQQKASKADEDAQNRKAMQTMLGGIDPGDPRAAQEFADRLARQQGWKSVVSKGGGKFDVEYDAAGRLDHDFTFPTVEGLPMVIPFVALIRRNDGTVRIDAPGFSPGAANPQIPGLVSTSDKGKENAPVLDGLFMLRTDGDILANNTDEGPKADPAGKRLQWKVNARTTSAPTALVRLAQ